MKKSGGKWVFLNRFSNLVLLSAFSFWSSIGYTEEIADHAVAESADNKVAERMDAVPDYPVLRKFSLEYGPIEEFHSSNVDHWKLNLLQGPNDERALSMLAQLRAKNKEIKAALDRVTNALADNGYIKSRLTVLKEQFDVSIEGNIELGWKRPGPNAAYDFDQYRLNLNLFVEGTRYTFPMMGSQKDFDNFVEGLCQRVQENKSGYYERKKQQAKIVLEAKKDLALDPFFKRIK